MRGTRHRVQVRLQCPGHKHDLCMPIDREVPKELRCPEEQSSGFGRSGGGGCPIPPDLNERVYRELRDAMQESRRRGFVLIAV